MNSHFPYAILRVFLVAGGIFLLIGCQDIASEKAHVGVGLDTGIFSHDVLLTNWNSADLSDVDITVTCIDRDGSRTVYKRFWWDWVKQKQQRVNVPSRRYHQIEVSGTARQGGKSVNVKGSSNFDWK